MTMTGKFTRQWVSAATATVLIVLGCCGAAARQAIVHRPIGTDLDGWGLRGNTFASQWTIGKAGLNPESPKKLMVAPPDQHQPELINKSRGGTDIYTKALFGDCTVELEVMVPKGSNSGVYLMGRYEIQIKDSFGKGLSLGLKEMGAVCGFAQPLVNAADEPGTWQKYVVVFKAPRFDNGKRTAPAEFVKVVLNGRTIHEHVKMTKGASSGALSKKEVAAGPLMFQGGLGAVAFRNIVITHIKE